MTENNVYDVLIVGSGVAGMYGALQFGDDTRVMILSKYEKTTSNSNLAQGGVAAVLDLEDDSYELHVKDTFIAGRHENDPEAVDVLVHEGPGDVRKTMALGVRFADETTSSYRDGVSFSFPRTKLIHVDLQGEEINKNYRADVGIVGDINSVVDQLLAAYKEFQGKVDMKQAVAFLSQFMK